MDIPAGSFRQRFGIQFSTMGAPTTGEGSAAMRFTPYIEELQEFFASSCLRYGSPEDIIELAERLDSSPAFAEDLSSMIRSIVLREGGELVHSQLLEILAVAIGGPKMDHAPQQFGMPLRNLLSFMTGVLRKPWNEPPGEPVRPHHAEILPFPVRPRPSNERFGGQAATISAAADRAANSRHSKADAPPLYAPRLRALGNPPNFSTVRDPLASPDPRAERHVPDLVGEPTAADTSALDPEVPAHQAIEYPDLPPWDSEDEMGGYDDQTPGFDEHTAGYDDQSPGYDEPNFGAAASLPDDDPDPPPPPPLFGEILSEPPSWQVAAESARSGAPVTVTSIATPVAAAAAATRAVVPAKPSVHVEASSSALASPGIAEDVPSALAAAPFAKSAAQSTPHTNPDPASVDPLLASFTPHVPRTPAGMLVAVAALLVVAGIVAASFHRTTELVGKQVAAPLPATTQASTSRVPAVSKASRASAAGTPAASTSGVAPRMRRAALTNDDEDADERGVAPPYSTPIPGQPLPKPSPYITPAQEQTAESQPVRPPSNEIASTGSVPVPAGVASGHNFPAQSYAATQPPIHAYRSPDAAIAGDLPRSSRGSHAVLSERPNYVDVSSGMMASNLISAPVPDYPALARIAHVRGDVVIQAVIAKNGTVLATHVLRGPRLLRGAAQDAVRQWRYRPYVMDGHPVEVSTIVTVRFKPKG